MSQPRKLDSSQSRTGGVFFIIDFARNRQHGVLVLAEEKKNNNKEGPGTLQPHYSDVKERRK